MVGKVNGNGRQDIEFFEEEKERLQEFSIISYWKYYRNEDKKGYFKCY